MVLTQIINRNVRTQAFSLIGNRREKLAVQVAGFDQRVAAEVGEKSAGRIAGI